MRKFLYHRINVVGAPGSGCSTLGRALSRHLNITFIDADDFYWQPTTPPFQEKFEPEVRLSNILQTLKAASQAVVSGSICGWGAPLEDSFDLIIFLLLSTEIRIQRIKAREISLFGQVNPAFLEWASQYEVGRLAGRSRARHEAWLAHRQCRVLRLEGEQPVEERIKKILRQCTHAQN